MQPKIAFFLSHFKRPEYLEYALKSLEQYTEKDNIHFYIVEDDNPNTGLRNRIIDFFEAIKDKDYDILIKGDADCIFPPNYIHDMARKLIETGADILSPNVTPSNAAFTQGTDDVNKKGYRPTEVIGGLWCMKASLIKDMFFERVGTIGLTGAVTILKQIAIEKDPVMGWLTDITVDDVGHWAGKHPLHIKTKDHEFYSKTVGRQIGWTVERET